MKSSRKNYLNSELIICILIFVITFLSRIFFIEKYFYDGDTVGVALGSINYSLQNTRPHLPGYFLHVKIISLLNYFINDLHLSMILLSAIYSSLGAALCYKLLRKWFDIKNSLFITALIVFNPMVWYYGSTPEVYSFDLFFSVLLLMFLLNGKGIYYTPIILGLASGVRQSSGLLLLPLYFYIWYKMIKLNKPSILKVIASHVIGILTFLAWFIPMINSVGGLNEYFSLYKSNSPLPNISLLQNIFQFSSYCFYIIIPILILILFAGPRKIFKRNFYDEFRTPFILFLLWLIPSVITFVILTYHKGYFLISIVPLYGFIGLIFAKNIIKQRMISSVIILEILFFVFMPYKELPLQSITAPEKRSQNIFTIWIERTFSSYLMASSRINYQDEVIEELSTFVEKVKDNKIFLDPTIYLAARGLQYKYQNFTFITMDFQNRNNYLEYDNLNIEVKNGFDKILNTALLITRNDFYLSNKEVFGNTIQSSNNYSLILIDEKNRSNIFKLYQNQFLR